MAKYISIYVDIFKQKMVGPGWPQGTLKREIVLWRICIGLLVAFVYNCLGNDPEKSGWFWNSPENGKWYGKIRIVVTFSGKWEMIWKNPDSCDALRKIGNDPEKSGQLWNWKRGNSPNEPKYCRVAMLPFYPGFCTSGGPDSQIKQMLHF